MALTCYRGFSAIQLKNAEAIERQKTWKNDDGVTAYYLYTLCTLPMKLDVVARISMIYSLDGPDQEIRGLFRPSMDPEFISGPQTNETIEYVNLDHRYPVMITHHANYAMSLDPPSSNRRLTISFSFHQTMLELRILLTHKERPQVGIVPLHGSDVPVCGNYFTVSSDHDSSLVLFHLIN